MLLVSGWFSVSKTIIPDAQEHFLTPSARRDIYLFGGSGFKGLPDYVRQERVNVTRENAKAFIAAWRKRGKLLTPVGVMQGTSPQQYADNVGDYCDMGYRHLAIGGLVPLKDSAISEIVRAVSYAADRLAERPWLHLFGIFRPNLQTEFRQLGVDSFDSASYLRKAWLRSDQNYLGPNGKWYAAIRAPMSSDPRTAKRLREDGVDVSDMQRQEQNALDSLARFGQGGATVSEVLDAVLYCDSRLTRASEVQSMRERYKRTLEDKPWRTCECTFCRQLGIHILIFRGANRNKRRGAHNTALLHKGIRANS